MGKPADIIFPEEVLDVSVKICSILEMKFPLPEYCLVKIFQRQLQRFPGICFLYFAK